MVFGCDCIARFDGKTIFVPLALPNETLDVSIVQDKKNFSQARIQKIVTPSPHRIEPKCPYFGECGGCNFQYADYAYQCELKKAIVAESFSRAKVSIPSIEFIPSEPWEYRSRFQFHLNTKLGSLTVGLKERSTERIIPIKDCPVAVGVIREALQNGAFTCTSNEEEKISDRFTVMGGKEITSGNTDHPHLVWKSGTYTAHITPYSDGIEGSGESGSPKDLHADVQGFFQANIPMLEKLIPSVCADINGKRVLDLYCGVGTFSLFLVDSFDEVVLVEEDKDSINYAKKNLASSKAIISAHAMNVEKWITLERARQHFDAVIVDPPRTGLDKTVIQYLIGKKVRTLRYISCDTATLARDTALLCAGGYAIKKLMVFDFYPQTNHIECAAFLEWNL